MPAKVIVFTGIDGSGKTTQAMRLKDQLERRGYSVRYRHQYLTQGTLKTKLEVGIRKFWLSLRPHDVEGDQVTAAVLLRSIVGWVLAQVLLARGWFRAWEASSRKELVDVVILDRAFHDELIRVAWRFEVVPLWARVALERLPAPDLVFELRVEPSLGQERKKNGSLQIDQYLRKKLISEAILTSASDLWPWHPIDVTGRTIEDVEDEVLRKVSTLLTTDEDQRQEWQATSNPPGPLSE